MNHVTINTLYIINGIRFCIEALNEQRVNEKTESKSLEDSISIYEL